MATALHGRQSCARLAVCLFTEGSRKAPCWTCLHGHCEANGTGLGWEVGSRQTVLWGPWAAPWLGAYRLPCRCTRGVGQGILAPPRTRTVEPSPPRGCAVAPRIPRPVCTAPDAPLATAQTPRLPWNPAGAPPAQLQAGAGQHHEGPWPRPAQQPGDRTAAPRGPGEITLSSDCLPPCEAPLSSWAHGRLLTSPEDRSPWRDPRVSLLLTQEKPMQPMAPHSMSARMDGKELPVGK